VEEKSDSVGRIPKVVVGILSRGTLPAAFIQSREGAMIGNGELFEATYAYASWHITDDGRNTVVQTALEQDFDYIFFMDTDMIFNRGTLGMMIRDMAKIKEDQPPVLGGIYSSRTDDHRWHVYRWDEAQLGWHSMRFELNNGLVKVDAIGTGCMLIDVNVFKVIEWPWFEYNYFVNPMLEKVRESEDMVFCKKCMEAKIPIYATSNVTAGHMHSMQIWPTEDGGYEIKTLAGDVF